METTIQLLTAAVFLAMSIPAYVFGYKVGRGVGWQEGHTYRERLEWGKRRKNGQFKSKEEQEEFFR
jgi:hypothetical protein